MNTELLNEKLLVVEFGRYYSSEKWTGNKLQSLHWQTSVQKKKYLSPMSQRVSFLKKMHKGYEYTSDCSNPN